MTAVPSASDASTAVDTLLKALQNASDTDKDWVLLTFQLKRLPPDFRPEHP